MKEYYEYCVETGDDTYYGVTCAKDYSDAVESIISFYDDEDIKSIRVEDWGQEGCLVITKSGLEDLKKNCLV